MSRPEKEQREDLVIDLSFLQCLEQIELGDGLIKQISEQGELDPYEQDYPVDESRVKLQYESRTSCGRLVDPFKYYTQQVYFMVKQIELQGIKIGIKTMKQGEEAYFIVPVHLHYGQDYKMIMSDGQETYLDGPLIYKIKLVDYSTPRPNYHDSSTPLSLLWNYLRRLKAQGNKLYGQQQPIQADQHYKKGYHLLNQFPKNRLKNLNEEERSIMTMLVVAIGGNHAQCLMAQNKYSQALKVLITILQYQPENVKNLKRQACVLTALHFYDQAQEVYHTLLKLDQEQQASYQTALLKNTHQKRVYMKRAEQSYKGYFDKRIRN